MLPYDIHRMTAAAALGIKYEDVTEAQRKGAKTANYALMYGGQREL